MASLEMNIPHKLPQNEALARIKKLLTETKSNHADKITNLEETWNNNVGTFSFIAKGFSVSGTLTVTSSEVKLDGQIPFALSFFKGTIKQAITNEANQLLS